MPHRLKHGLHLREGEFQKVAKEFDRSHNVPHQLSRALKRRR